MAKDETGIPLVDMLEDLYKKYDKLELRVRQLESWERHRQGSACSDVGCHLPGNHTGNCLRY